MSKSTLLVIGLVIALALGALIYYTAQYYGPSSDQATPPPPPVSRHETITAKHQFKDGKHIVAGEVNVPTPCHILTAGALVAESFPEQVTIDFRASTTADVCAQVLTLARFKIEFQASEKASIRAMWNGEPVELNLIPAAPGENLEDFEIYIKG